MNSSRDAQESLEEGAWLFDLIDQLGRDREQGRLRRLENYLERFPGHDMVVAREYLAVTASDPGAGPPGQPIPGKTLGPYRIESECARGGQSVVYLAVDERDRHKVAIKVLYLPPALLSTNQRARFRREARVIAGLSHPGLCGFEQASLDGPLPYIVMPRLTGLLLSQHITGMAPSEQCVVQVPPRNPSETDDMLLLIESVARALHVAHEAGVVHRDIKPGNIMVQPNGSPVIFDFGLACFEEPEGSRITRSHETFGTPAYMAPEQFEWGGAEPDRRCDIYSLGVTLYECATGRRPHGDGPRECLLQAIRSQDRMAAGALNPALPADLDRVLDVALDPERERRQGSALDLAEDLRAVREGRRPRSRPPGGLVRLGRWYGRHPRLTILLLALLPVLGTGLGLTQLLLGRARKATRETQGLYLGTLASRLCDEDPAAALLVSMRALERSPNTVARTALYEALVGSALSTTIEGLLPRASAVAFSPDGRFLAAGSAGGEIKVLDLESHRIRYHFSGHQDAVSSLSFDPSGRLLLSGSFDSTARLWDLEKGALRHVLHGHERALKVACFDPSGRLILTGSHDGTACLWDVVSGRPLGRLDGHEGAVTSGCFSPDGRLIVTASGDLGLSGDIDSVRADNTARVWDTSTGRLLVTLRHDDWVTCAEFDRAGRHVVSAGRDGLVQVADARDGRVLRHLEFPTPVLRAHFSPDGRRLATAFEPVREDSSIYRTGVLVWDLARERPALALVGHGGQTVSEVAWSHDGTRLATSSYDRTIRIWDAATGVEQACLRGHGRFVYSVVWSPDDRYLVSRSPESWVGVWRTTGSKVIPVLQGGKGAVRNLVFSPDARLLATAQDDGTVTLWSVPAGEVMRVLEHENPTESAALRTLAFDATGRRLAVGRADGAIDLWRLPAGKRMGTLRAGEKALDWIAFAGANHRLVSGSKEGEAVIWDLDAMRSLTRLEVRGGGLRSLALGPDGKRLATGDGQRTTRLYDVESGTQLWEFVYRSSFSVHKDVVSLGFSPDGERLVVMPPGGRAHLLDVRSGHQVAQWTGVVAGPVAFGPAGRLAAFGHRFDPRLVLVDCRSGQVCTGLRGHRDAIASVSFNPAGTRLLSASQDGSARLWDLERHRPYATLDGHDGPLRRACFSPDGRWIATVSTAGNARLWPLDPLPAARQSIPRALRAGELASLGVPAAER